MASQTGGAAQKFFCILFVIAQKVTKTLGAFRDFIEKLRSQNTAQAISLHECLATRQKFVPASFDLHSF
jgi:hypothetical protein